MDTPAGSMRVDPGRIAAVGYCYGGTAVLELARGGADLKAVVGFHSGLRPPGRRTPRPSSAKVLVQIWPSTTW